MELTENQSNVLYTVAQAAQVNVVHSRQDEGTAWETAFNRYCDDKRVRNALAKRGIVTDDKLNLAGLAQAKKIWTEAGKEDEPNWDHATAQGVIKREEEAIKDKADREAWRAYVKTFPVPEGYVEPIPWAPFSIEWKTADFSYAPTISISDNNYGFGADPEKGHDYRMSFSTGSSMKPEAVAHFKAALDIAHKVMVELQEAS